MSPARPRSAGSVPGDLIRLFHHRWALPVLAELAGGRSTGRFAALARRLGVARGTLRQTLDALGRLDLVGPNPGYGHPLRPEYVLTGRGRAIGDVSCRFTAAVRRAGLQGVAGRKWSMPVLAAVRRGGRRFSELEAALPGITARALALALEELERAGLVERRVTEERPPGARYRATRRGGRLADVVDGLVTNASRSARGPTPARRRRP